MQCSQTHTLLSINNYRWRYRACAIAMQIDSAREKTRHAYIRVLWQPVAHLWTVCEVCLCIKRRLSQIDWLTDVFVCLRRDRRKMTCDSAHTVDGAQIRYTHKRHEQTHTFRTVHIDSRHATHYCNWAYWNRVSYVDTHTSTLVCYCWATVSDYNCAIRYHII